MGNDDGINIWLALLLITLFAVMAFYMGGRMERARAASGCPTEGDYQESLGRCIEREEQCNEVVDFWQGLAKEYQCRYYGYDYWAKFMMGADYEADNGCCLRPTGPNSSYYCVSIDMDDLPDFYEDIEFNESYFETANWRIEISMANSDRLKINVANLNDDVDHLNCNAHVDYGADSYSNTGQFRCEAWW